MSRRRRGLKKGPSNYKQIERKNDRNIYKKCKMEECTEERLGVVLVLKRTFLEGMTNNGVQHATRQGPWTLLPPRR